MYSATGPPLRAKAAVVAAAGLAALILLRADTGRDADTPEPQPPRRGDHRDPSHPLPRKRAGPVPAGALARPDQVRLLGDDEEIPAQFAAGSRWPDGSVQWLRVDFNASIGPEETRSYRVEYGPGVGAEAELGRGLALVEDANGIQVGRVRFSKNAAAVARLGQLSR